MLEGGMTQQKKKLLILIGGHFALGPRPQKEAAAGVKAGFEVFIRGTWWDATLAREDLEIAKKINADFEPLIDLTHSCLMTKIHRARQKAAKLLLSKTGYASARSFGSSGPEMLREVNRIRPDLVMVHSEAGLWAASRLIKSGYRVGVDFEDWFSEDLALADRKNRPVHALQAIEKNLLRNARPILATSECMADSLQKWANSSRRPVAIPNSFPWKTRPAECNKQCIDGPVKLFWFSQTIGPSRGLENLAAALKRVSGKWELHLLGNLRGYKDWFVANFREIEENVYIHSPVTNEELPKKVCFYDIGLALEVPHCASRDLTATNKIFEYLRCGLPVIASDTAGQREVVSKCADAAWLVPPYEVDVLRQTIQRIIDNPSVLIPARTAALYAAQNVWAWELFEPQLISELLSGVEARR